MKKMSLISKSVVTTFLAMSPFLWAGEKIDEIRNTNANGEVFIDVMSGNVEIKTWQKNQVQVRGELDDKAEGYVFEEDGDRIVFEVKMPKRGWGNGWNSDWSKEGSQLTIWMPSTNNLKFEGVNVDVQVADVLGGSRVNTVNGDVTAANLSKRVALETVNGEVKAENLSGRIRLNTVNGEVLDKNSSGKLTIETVNGDIHTTTKATEINVNNVNGDLKITTDKAKELNINTVNGDLDLMLSMIETGRFVFSSVGGDADIYVDADISASFDIEAHAGGDIDNDLTSDRSKKEKYGPGEKLRFKTGSGKADIEIDTVSGDIYLKKK
ncbi:MAG: DUF4097 family beta strand repeat protein [Gammaproteobacteria bacterium]|nr:DUF4097 family beta strand repeat protein [Gammaproteobacteria bacterium]